MNKDRKETTKYLHDLNEQTPFKCLTVNYIDQVRAVLNYGFLGLDCFKNSNNLNIPNDNTGSSDNESDTDSNTGSDTGSDTGTGGGTDTGTDEHGNDTPTICEASSFTPMPPDRSLLTADAPDDGNSYGILITAMLRTKEQEALLYHVVDVKRDAGKFEGVAGSQELLTRAFLSSLNLPNLGENDDVHTNPTAFNKDWFTRLNVPFDIDWTNISLEIDTNAVLTPSTVSGIDTNNKHIWGEGVLDELKESYNLVYGHTFIHDPDTITITRATQEEQDAYLRIGDEYSTIPNSIVQAMNIVKRVDLIDVVNSGNDIVIKSCLKVVPDLKAIDDKLALEELGCGESAPEPYDKNLHFKIIENTSGCVFYRRWESLEEYGQVELKNPKKVYLIPFDLNVGEEFTISVNMTYGTGFSIIPEEMDSDNTNDWKLRGIRKEILSVKFEQEDIYNIKANRPLENTIQFSLTQTPFRQHSDRIDSFKILRISPTNFLLRVAKIDGNDFIPDYPSHLKDIDYEKGIDIVSNEPMTSFTLRLKGIFQYITIQKMTHSD